MKIGYILAETRINLIQVALDQNLKYCPPGDLYIFTDPIHIPILKETLGLEKFNIFFEHTSTDEPFLVHNYNLLLTSIEFWQKVLPYDRVVIFQADSEIFKPGIEDFFEYDYIGAPWKNYDPDYYPYVGNGGLSIRNPKVMYSILLENTWGKDMGEDLFFTRKMVETGYGKLAPYEVAQKFAVESIFYPGTLGAHAIDKWLSKEQCNELRKQYDNL